MLTGEVAALRARHDGTADRILPFENTAKRQPGLIKDVTVIPVENGPHNIGWTYPEVVNPALLSFLAS